MDIDEGLLILCRLDYVIYVLCWFNYLWHVTLVASIVIVTLYNNLITLSTMLLYYIELLLTMCKAGASVN